MHLALRPVRTRRKVLASWRAIPRLTYTILNEKHFWI